MRITEIKKNESYGGRIWKGAPDLDKWSCTTWFLALFVYSVQLNWMTDDNLVHLWGGGLARQEGKLSLGAVESVFLAKLLDTRT